MPNFSLCAISEVFFLFLIPDDFSFLGYPKGSTAMMSIDSGTFKKEATFFIPFHPVQFDPTPADHAARTID